MLSTCLLASMSYICYRLIAQTRRVQRRATILRLFFKRFFDGSNSFTSARVEKRGAGASWPTSRLGLPAERPRPHENSPMKRTVGLRCTICHHPARPQIDLAIATGLSKRAVAERFGVSRDAVWRHAQAHLTAEMRAALATKLLQREGDTRRILLEEGAGVTETLKAVRGPLFGVCLRTALWTAAGLG